MDDHPINRLVTLAQLAALGYAAEAADSGEMALAVLAGASYDAVLLDCEMPELNGYDTCRRLRQREAGGRRTPVIALTAHVAAEERERCLAAGMDDHLGKPVQGDELAAMLSHWLEDEAEVLEERLAALERLGEKTGKQVLAQVIASFLHQGERDIETLRRTLAHGDSTAFAAAAHSLAGSAGILGATRLAAGCAELETLARQEDLVACEPRIESVEQAFRWAAQRLSR